MSGTLQVLGICRFSYLGSGGFKVEHPDLAARREFLYDPERMEERFRLFEAITLPSVRGQTDPDFTFLVVTGDSLPPPFMDRLRDLLSDIPQARIKTCKPGKHRQVMRRAVLEARQPSDLPFLQFRLDDDDAMGVRFVERFRQTARDLQPLWSRHPAIAVDFNTGYVFTAGPEGVKIWPYQYAYSAIALGMIVQPGHKDTIMNHGHLNLWKSMPTITFPDEDMMLRGHNDFNDSRIGGKGNTFDYRPLTPEDEARLKAAFNLDNAAVRRIFSAP